MSFIVVMVQQAQAESYFLNADFVAQQESVWKCGLRGDNGMW
jgi:hypothetical protein